MSSAAAVAEGAHYLPTIRERWAASELVCIGRASSLVRTGQTQIIDGADRDQLSANVELETCFKGKAPEALAVRVVGYDVFATKRRSQAFAYAGPPTGFLSEGRNLLFLRRTREPDEFEVAVPVYETAIHLADTRPDRTSSKDTQSVPTVLTEELEAAAVQFGDTNLSYINYVFDLLGPAEATAELFRFSRGVPLPIQRDLAVTLLSHGQRKSEPIVISLLLDTSAPAWKRENAALALGEHGTEAALAPLQEIAAERHTDGEEESLYLDAVSSLDRLRNRLQSTKP
jgi:hypothetical protein